MEKEVKHLITALLLLNVLVYPQFSWEEFKGRSVGLFVNASGYPKKYEEELKKYLEEFLTPYVKIKESALYEDDWKKAKNSEHLNAAIVGDFSSGKETILANIGVYKRNDGFDGVSGVDWDLLASSVIDSSEDWRKIVEKAVVAITEERIPTWFTEWLKKYEKEKGKLEQRIEELENRVQQLEKGKQSKIRMLHTSVQKPYFWFSPKNTRNIYDINSYSQIPGLSLTFSVDTPSTLEITFTGLVMNSSANKLTYTCILVDKNFPITVRDSGGIKWPFVGGSTSSNSKQYNTTANTCVVDVGKGNHTVEVRGFCSGGRGQIYAGLLTTAIYPK